MLSIILDFLSSKEVSVVTELPSLFGVWEYRDSENVASSPTGCGRTNVGTMEATELGGIFGGGLRSVTPSLGDGGNFEGGGEGLP